MNALPRLVVIFVAILFISHIGNSLKCYVCNTKSDPKCFEPQDEENGLELTNCTNNEQQKMDTRKAIEEISNLLSKLGQPSSSRKVSQQWEDEKFPMVCQRLELTVEGENVIGRGCSAPRMENFDPCYAVKLITSSDIVLKSCSLCDTDGCNKGIRNHSTSLLHLIAIMITGAYIYT